jgi:uncharacterized PurR-regulated membrane protein YhhQ (DUF165 family)
MKKIAAFALFASTIPAANWLIGNVGQCIPDGPCLVPVGFGLMAPTGVLMIGAALVLRDWLHEMGGARLAIAAVIFGALLSLLVSPPALAVASAVAFLIAELCDTAVYTPLRKRWPAWAVLASGAVGAAVDSMIFVWMAFGSLEFSAGTTLAKVYASLAVACWIAWRSRK